MHVNHHEPALILRQNVDAADLGNGAAERPRRKRRGLASFRCVSGRNTCRGLVGSGRNRLGNLLEAHALGRFGRGHVNRPERRCLIRLLQEGSSLKVETSGFGFGRRHFLALEPIAVFPSREASVRNSALRSRAGSIDVRAEKAHSRADVRTGFGLEHGTQRCGECGSATERA